MDLKLHFLYVLGIICFFSLLIHGKCYSPILCIDGWMDNLRLYVLFNSISVISGRWADDKERLYAMNPVTAEMISPRAGLDTGSLDE